MEGKFSEVIILGDGTVVPFGCVDMSEFTHSSYGTASRYLSPIVDRIGHPVITMAYYHGKWEIYYFEDADNYGFIDSYHISAGRVSVRTGRPQFDEKIDHYRKFEISATDWKIANLLVESGNISDEIYESRKTIREFERSLVQLREAHRVSYRASKKRLEEIAKRISEIQNC